MKTKALRIISILLLVILILSLVTLTAGAIAKSNLAKQYPAPGQLVDVGGYKMHIHCTGQGSPTVILAAGTADFSTTWAYVQPEVAKLTRVCAYDRAGLGWSEPSPLPLTVKTTVDELHTLLVNARVQGPYVLVGHSLGGMHMRAYAHNYPDEVVGLIQVDSLHEVQAILDPVYTKANQVSIQPFRMLALLNSTGIMALAPQSIPNQGLPDDAYAQYQASLATTNFFTTTIAEVEAQAGHCAEVRALKIANFGNMPLIVITRGRANRTASLSDTENQQSEDVWQALQSELVALSSQGQQIIAEQSGHMIQFDQPELVIDAIRTILDTLRNGSN
jgi:pimeloyl-ACP methyl ester carboxylesterase